MHVIGNNGIKVWQWQKQSKATTHRKRKAMNLQEFLDGLAVKSAAKRTGKETKSIVDTDEQLASKPTARKTRKEVKSIDEQSTSKPAAKQTRKEAKSIDIDEQSASKPAAKRARKEAKSRISHMRLGTSSSVSSSQTSSSSLWSLCDGNDEEAWLLICPGVSISYPVQLFSMR